MVVWCFPLPLTPSLVRVVSACLTPSSDLVLLPLLTVLCPLPRNSHYRCCCLGRQVRSRDRVGGGHALTTRIRCRSAVTVGDTEHRRSEIVVRAIWRWFALIACSFARLFRSLLAAGVSSFSMKNFFYCIATCYHLINVFNNSSY